MIKQHIETVQQSTMCFTLTQNQEFKGERNYLATKNSALSSPPGSLLVSSYSQLSSYENGCHEHHHKLSLDAVPVFLPKYQSILGSENEATNKENGSEDDLLSHISLSRMLPNLSQAKTHTRKMKEVVITKKQVDFFSGDIPPLPFSFPDVDEDRCGDPYSESNPRHDIEIKSAYHKCQGCRSNGAKLESLPYKRSALSKSV